MLFNSLDFALFLPIVFCLYWFIKKDNIKFQNFLILIASYFFYAWWDWRFLFLILFSTVTDYFVGYRLSFTNTIYKRKLLLLVSIAINLGFLGFFKYYEFFVQNFISAFSLFGYKINSNSLNIILPVGISFYTFQTLSYTIDIYRKKINPTKDFVTFAAFVSFFPQLVAGPIERASNLIPQFLKKRNFKYDNGVDGMRQILWGLFKKVVIADNCAEFANQIFNNSAEMYGSALVLGAIFFAFQIYCDFSGYSDIAIGTSKLFGINLKKNFSTPYFSRDIAEFWRKWHISLSSWFRDYVYIPLGGSRVDIYLKIRNTFIIFILSGFWHGANWTFIFWGFLNALFFLPLQINNKNRKNLDIVGKENIIPSFNEIISMVKTFSLTVFAWIFFRAESLSHAFNYLGGIFSKTLFLVPQFDNRKHAITTLILIIIFLIIEWMGRKDKYALEKILLGLNKIVRQSIYLILILFLFYFSGKPQDFIYFQF